MHYYTIDYTKEDTFEFMNGLYFNKKLAFLEFRNDIGQAFRIELYPGFITDGLSIPKPFQWFLPCWNKDNMLYNLAGCCHDFCYGSECLCKEYADDLLRGIMRDAGYNRFKASTACFCVQKFASRHYGRDNDEFDVANNGRLIIL